MELARLRDETVEPLMQRYRQSGGGAAGVGDFDDEFFSATEDEHAEL
jgi:acyl transferase domain-containing protein